MSNFVFLDDFKKPNNVSWIELPNTGYWHVVNSYNQFVDHINKYGIPDFVCYDHDLDDEHYVSTDKIDYTSFKVKTGYDCAKFLIEKCKERGVKHPRYLIHSLGVLGTENINNIIRNYNNTIS